MLDGYDGNIVDKILQNWSRQCLVQLKYRLRKYRALKCAPLYQFFSFFIFASKNCFRLESNNLCNLWRENRETKINVNYFVDLFYLLIEYFYMRHTIDIITFDNFHRLRNEFYLV